MKVNFKKWLSLRNSQEAIRQTTMIYAYIILENVRPEEELAIYHKWIVEFMRKFGVFEAGKSENIMSDNVTYREFLRKIA